MSNRKPRIDLPNAIGLIGLAALFDVLGILLNIIGLIPYLGQIIAWPSTIILGIVAWVIFTIWFLILRVGFFSPKKIVSALVGGTVELIPVLNMLPGLTIAIILIISTTNFEDATGIKFPGSKIGGMK